jgi:hypothetical protein
MPAVQKAEPLAMSFCLKCHRAPEKNLRPVEEVTNMAWAPPSDPAVAEVLGEQLKEHNQVHTRTSCTTCHR